VKEISKIEYGSTYGGTGYILEILG